MTPSVIAFVGAGGKTSSCFALARCLADDGARVLVTTTTRMLHPAAATEREGRGFGVVLEFDDPGSPDALARIAQSGPRVVLGLGGAEPGKLRGIDPKGLHRLSGLFDYVIVEADGARGLSIKAPGDHEPVVPSCCTVVVGIMGLDAVGAPMDGRVVHRPELFGPIAGCAPGESIAPIHLSRLVASPLGLFKGVPESARRIVLLNKADAVPAELAAACRSEVLATGTADAVVLGSLGVPEGGPSR